MAPSGSYLRFVGLAPEQCVRVLTHWYHNICRWDNVEELSAAAAHKKVAFANDPVSNDPLEQFCDDNPDADECRVYDD